HWPAERIRGEVRQAVGDEIDRVARLHDDVGRGRVRRRIMCRPFTEFAGWAGDDAAADTVAILGTVSQRAADGYRAAGGSHPAANHRPLWGIRVAASRIQQCEAELRVGQQLAPLPVRACPLWEWGESPRAILA